MRPFYKSILENQKGFIVTIKFKLYFKNNVILPPFTSKITKLLIYSDDCFRKIREMYESRMKFRPVTLSTLHTLTRNPLYKKDGREERPILVREGSVLTTSITYYDQTASSLDPLIYSCNGNLKEPFNEIEYSIWEIEVTRLEDLRLGLDKNSIIRLDFKTPFVVSTKIMTPPSLRSHKVIQSMPNEYRLLPTPAYVASSSMRVWLGIINKVNPEDYYAPYGIGRLADILMPEVDYRLRPVTVIYGKDKIGRLRKIRGVIGYVVYKIRSKKLALTMDILLSLSAKMGLGKNRSIGFGEITVSQYR